MRSKNTQKKFASAGHGITRKVLAISTLAVSKGSGGVREENAGIENIVVTALADRLMLYPTTLAFDNPVSAERINVRCRLKPIKI